MVELGIETVIIGLAIFSIIKIVIFMILSERFLPKIKVKRTKEDKK